MIEPFIKIYEGDNLSGPTLDVMFLKGFAGTLKNIFLYVGGNVAEEAVFNITKNGVALFAGANRIIIPVGANQAQLAGLAIEIVQGDVLFLDLEECGASGVSAPITLVLQIDDGASGGGGIGSADLDGDAFGKSFGNKIEKIQNRKVDFPPLGFLSDDFEAGSIDAIWNIDQGVTQLEGKFIFAPADEGFGVYAEATLAGLYDFTDKTIEFELAEFSDNSLLTISITQPNPYNQLVIDLSKDAADINYVNDSVNRVSEIVPFGFADVKKIRIRHFASDGSASVYFLKGETSELQLNFPAGTIFSGPEIDLTAGSVNELNPSQVSLESFKTNVVVSDPVAADKQLIWNNTNSTIEFGDAPTGDGADGLSAYEIAVNNGFAGSESAWLASLAGDDGTDGSNGTNGSNGAGVPAGGAAGQILEKTDGTDYSTQWVNKPAGASLNRTTQVFSTASIADTVNANLDVAVGKSSQLFIIETNAPARIRAYPTNAGRTADTGRALGTEDVGEIILFEAVTTVGNLKLTVFDAATLFNADNPATDVIYWAIQNRSGITQIIDTTITKLVLEN